MKENNRAGNVAEIFLTVLIILHSLVILLINVRIGQGGIVSLGDLSAKRLFKSFDRAPEAALIAWGIFCVMLYIRYIIWKKRT